MKSATRDEGEGKWHKVKGKIKEVAGKVSMNPGLEAEGKEEARTGEVEKKSASSRKSSGIRKEPNMLYMKKGKMFIRGLLLMMLVVGLAACGSTSKQSGPGEYVDDSVITTKVKSQLAADDFLKSFEISVETYKGVVQLSGFVDTQIAVNRAGEIARGVQGVSSVKNNLNVKK